ncbi:MAG: tRNA (guanosine(37)-N1)-methyltransferase TrmD [Candidatus Stahlbacteria bacterium]|nr:tRNA (guanosine(37)-N1)-methyltransferase TrmD [Candidatus Stahlbacteria bacterium]
MLVDIFTIFPKMFDSPFSCGVIKIAKEKGVADIRIWDLRDFTDDPHHKVDDYPYGGGPGMVLMAEPIFKGVRSVKNDSAKVILLSPQGKRYTQSEAQKLATESHLILICGRYQGVDERVEEGLVDMERSIGDYVLAGGELASMVIIESIARLLPGVVGNFESIYSDSVDYFDPPLYTRPREIDGMSVPETLLSGNHKKIKEWCDGRREKWE